MTQVEARREAKRLNENWVEGTPIAVAVTDPPTAWGGHEKGWMVGYRLP